MPNMLTGVGRSGPTVNQPFDRIIGSFGDPLKLAFLTKVDLLAATRLANVPAARATTYYIAATGSDGAAGTIGAPWATVAKCIAHQAAIGGATNSAYLFNKGDTFREFVSMTVYPRTTIGAYGTGAKPIFTKFTIQYASGGGGWSLESGTTYQRTEAGDIAWLKFTGATGLSRPLERVATLVACRATSDSFTWVAGTLYINMGGTPASTNLEATVGSAADDFNCSGDNIRVEGIRLEGYGLRSNAAAINTYAFKGTTLTATDEQVFVNCEAYYTGYHAIGFIGPGICTASGCTTGLTRSGAGGGTTVAVGFSETGGHESIFYSHTTSHGNLWENGGGRINQCSAIYGHTTSGTAKLFIIRNHVITAGKWAAYQAGSPTNLPTAATITDARCFIINETYDNSNYDVTQHIDYYPLPQNTIHINCVFNLMPLANGSGAIGGGWAINTTYAATFYNVVFNSLFATGTAGTMYHCRLHTINYGAIYAAGTDPVSASGTKLRNCIVTCDPLGSLYSSCSPNIYQEVPADIDLNAWFSPDPIVANAQCSPSGTSGVGANDDAHKIMLAGTRAFDWVPPSDHPVGNAGTDYGLEYDQTGAARSGDKTLGPRKATTALGWTIGTYMVNGTCVLALEPNQWYTDTACTALSAANSSDACGGWKAAIGSNWTQATGGAQMTVASNGLVGASGKFLTGTLGTRSDWIVYALVTKAAASDDAIIFGNSAGLLQTVDLGPSVANVFDSGGEAAAHTIAFLGTGEILVRFVSNVNLGLTKLAGTAFDVASMTTSTAASLTTIDRIGMFVYLAAPFYCSPNVRIRGIWVFTGASTLPGTDDESNFLEYVKALTGRRLL